MSTAVHPIAKACSLLLVVVVLLLLLLLLLLLQLRTL